MSRDSNGQAANVYTEVQSLTLPKIPEQSTRPSGCPPPSCTRCLAPPGRTAEASIETCCRASGAAASWTPSGSTPNHLISERHRLCCASLTGPARLHPSSRGMPESQ